MCSHTMSVKFCPRRPPARPPARPPPHPRIWRRTHTLVESGVVVVVVEAAAVVVVVVGRGAEGPGGVEGEERRGECV